MSYAALRVTEKLGTIKILTTNGVKRSTRIRPRWSERVSPGLVAQPIIGFVGCGRKSRAARPRSSLTRQENAFTSLLLIEEPICLVGLIQCPSVREEPVYVDLAIQNEASAVCLAVL